MEYEINIQAPEEEKEKLETITLKELLSSKNEKIQDLVEKREKEFFQMTGYQDFIKEAGFDEESTQKLDKAITDFYQSYEKVNNTLNVLVNQLCDMRKKGFEVLKDSYDLPEEMQNPVFSPDDKKILKEYLKFTLEKHKFDILDLDIDKFDDNTNNVPLGSYIKHPFWCALLGSFLLSSPHEIGLAIIHDTAEDNIKRFKDYLQINQQINEGEEEAITIANAGWIQEEYYEFDEFVYKWSSRKANGNGTGKNFFEEITLENYDGKSAELKKQFINIYKTELKERFSKVFEKKEMNTHETKLDMVMDGLTLLTRKKGEEYKPYAEEMSDDKYSKELRELVMRIKIIDTAINYQTSFFYKYIPRKAKTKTKSILVRDLVSKYLNAARKESHTLTALKMSLGMHIAINYAENILINNTLEKTIQKESKGKDAESLNEIKEKTSEIIQEYTLKGGFYKITKEKPHKILGVDGTINRLLLLLKNNLEGDEKDKRESYEMLLKWHAPIAYNTFRILTKNDQHALHTFYQKHFAKPFKNNVKYFVIEGLIGD